ncbi:hypothetical protein C2G38_2174957 [Gigaspora rosea]|uniref:Uncharacterized protein n=1 Tax=Gigaspora rosea TaxID=44941 RepID=A0A397VL44_9GLOM|nr:hypothetical protein C2G38_2174957 [Gigaspora rosea]
MNLEELISLEQGENQTNKKKELAIKLVTLVLLFRTFSDIYNNYYLPSIVAEITITRYLEGKFEQKYPLKYLNKALLALEGA